MIATAGGIVAAAAHALHFHAQLVCVIELLYISKRGQKWHRSGKTQQGRQDE